MKERSLRKKPIQKRAEETVNTILESAYLILNQLGPDKFDQFQTGPVAKKAGVSIGTLYQYFPNKQALLAEVLDYCNRLDLEIVMDIAASHKFTDARQLVRACTLKVIRERYQKFTNLYKTIARHRDRMVRPETNLEMQEKIVSGVQASIEKHGFRSAKSRYSAFLIARGFIDLIRSTLIHRPEYIQDEVFHEAIADFLSATLVQNKNKSSS